MAEKRGLGGFTVIELLVALLVAAVVLAGTLTTLAGQSQVQNQQRMELAMEQNMRIAMDVLSDQIQFANVGVPRVSPEIWIPWVAGFTTNPKVTTSPTTISVAAATSYPVARLKSRALAGETSLNLVSAVDGKTVTDLLNTNQKRLISLDGEVHAHLMSVGASTVTINTQPTSKKNVGVPRSYPANTPIFRVDVQTFSLAVNKATGMSELLVDYNDGSAKSAVAEGITAMTITPVGEDGYGYRITLTGKAERPDPSTGVYLTRTISSELAMRDFLNDFDDIGEDDEADDEEF
jgi:type II secretory pathway pseudopilin PulG